MRDAEAKTSSNALILAGAAARGAFEAGVLTVLAEAGVPFRRVIGTSAGALNAVVFSAGLVTGRGVYAAKVLEELWVEHGAWPDFAHVSKDAWWHREGAFDTSKVEELVVRGIERVMSPAGAIESGGAPPDLDLKVTLVTTDLRGHVERAHDGAARTVYEQPEHFTAADFRDEAAWPRIAKAAAASAAFPGMFAPPMIDGTLRGDGGAVNNAPISYAIDDRAIRSVFVVSTLPDRPAPPPEDLGGSALIGHLADILISERLSRDLLAARNINERLQKVKEAMAGLAPGDKRAILGALGWRHIDLVEISPSESLAGSAFAGFLYAQLRRDYVVAGTRAAKAALARPSASVAGRLATRRRRSRQT